MRQAGSSFAMPARVPKDTSQGRPSGLTFKGGAAPLPGSADSVSRALLT